MDILYSVEKITLVLRNNTPISGVIYACLYYTVNCAEIILILHSIKEKYIARMPGISSVFINRYIGF